MGGTVRVELHCHSSFSDGAHSPEVLADLLAASGVQLAALTDHDTTAGLARFHQALAERGIGTITGVEIEASYEGGVVHLLAYRFDANDGALQEMLASIRGWRGFSGEAIWAELRQFWNWAVRKKPLTHLHPVPVAEAIERVHEAGGRVFLAHPLTVSKDLDELDRVLEDLKGLGLDGVEAFYKPDPPETREALAALAGKHGLLVSSGSDFHGGLSSRECAPGIDVEARHWAAFRDGLGLPRGDERLELDGGRGGHPGPLRGGMSPMRDALAALFSRNFAMHILLPTMLVITLFIVSIFVEFIPSLEEDLMVQKREMIRELTNSAWSILAEFEAEEQAGTMSRAEAQKQAIMRVEYLRYGVEGKDYFWLTDKKPTMLMHPYRKELVGKDLTDFTDHSGKHVFIEFVNKVEAQGEGYVDYEWQWMDDRSRVVPKLSYVRGFEPWGWIIGTGIYVEDVEEEIALVTAKEVKISLAIIAVSIVLLLYVARQSLKIEQKRSRAEQGLRASRERYRALVEASTDGTLMILDGRYIHSNSTMQSMLGYEAKELMALGIYDILPPDDSGEGLGRREFERLVAGEAVSGQFEAILRRKDGHLLPTLLDSSSVMMEGKQALIVIVKDMTRSAQAQSTLAPHHGLLRILTDSVNFGVFRTAFGRNSAFLEANPAAVRIFGCESKSHLLSSNLLSLFAHDEDGAALLDALRNQGTVRDRDFVLRRPDGSRGVVSMSIAVVRDESGTPRYCDGIVEDITELRRNEEARDRLIADLQASLLFLNEPIGQAVVPPALLNMNTPIGKAASAMTRGGHDAALVEADKGGILGIVTDQDLRARVLAEGADPGKPLFEVMSAPLVSVSGQALMFEAILKMQEHGVTHLAVRNAADKIVGLVGAANLFDLHRHSPAFLTREIARAESVDEIVAGQDKLKRLVVALLSCGAKPRNITRIVTAVSDAIVQRLIALAIDELGPPPCGFAFIALGSEGRGEQTLVTDQDNAIVYEDVARDQNEGAKAYFLELGGKVCTWFDQAGYAFCKGDVMARTAKWCVPLARWKEHFDGWINEAEPQNLIKFNIFFDFRCVYGESELVEQLRAHIDRSMAETPSFFLHFSQNTLLYKPPLSLFGGIQVESGGEKPSTFSIKDAMIPIVGFARIYALKHGVTEANTLERLERLFERDVLKKGTYEELSLAYDYLMQVRFQHQAAALAAGGPPDNLINPKELAEIEQVMVRKIFGQLGNFLKKISYDFLGVA